MSAATAASHVDKKQIITQAAQRVRNITTENASLIGTGFNRLVSYFPDSIIFGTIIFGIATMNYPVLVLFLFELETILAQRFLSSSTQTLFPTLTVPSADAKCKEGYYKNPTDARRTLMNLFGESSGSFPSRPLFLISAVISYLFSSLLSFQDVIVNLDKDYATRTSIAGISSALLLLTVFFLYYKSGCETVLHGLGTIVMGILLGGIGMMVHAQIFGRDAVNFLGLPLLTSGIESRAPLYVCAPTLK